MTVNTRVIKLFLRNNQKAYVPLKNGLRLQVVPDMSYLPHCQKHQFAAFVADRGCLVVWDDEPRHILDRANKIEKALMEMIWDNSASTDDEKKEAAVDIDEVGFEDDVERGILEEPRKISLLMPISSACTLAVTILAIGSGWRQIAFQTAVDGNYLRIAFILALIPQIWLALFFFQALVSAVSYTHLTLPTKRIV